jgi:GTP cyclohydrolase I
VTRRKKPVTIPRTPPPKPAFSEIPEIGKKGFPIRVDQEVFLAGLTHPGEPISFEVTWSGFDFNEPAVEHGVEIMLLGMGCDLKSANFKDTPKRVAKLFREMLTPEENNWATFPARDADLVLLRGHRIVAVCPHHLQPVELRCYIAYIPNELTVGLSKLARVAEGRLTRPIMQEELGHEIADELDKRLKPKAVGVVLAGTHGCMRFRGVESTGDVVTSAMRGAFLLNPAARQELLTLIGRP